MNTITYRNKNVVDTLVINSDTKIEYIDCDARLNIKVDGEVKIFEYIKNSKVDNIYDIDNSLLFDRFSVNSSIKTKLNLDKEEVSLDYFYSCINTSDNKYVLDICHNCKNTKSVVVNNGINLKSGKLDFIVNGIILKDSSNVLCNQSNSIIVFDYNNATIKPNLIVDNNDISANHSAYIGKFKEEDVFYLKSRGLSLKEAYKLLTKAFLVGEREMLFKENFLILKEIDDYWR